MCHVNEKGDSWASEIALVEISIIALLKPLLLVLSRLNKENLVFEMIQNLYLCRHQS